MWHEIKFSCPNCKCQPRIVKVHANSDADILLDMVCPLCKQSLNLCFTHKMLEAFGRQQDSQYFIRLNQLPFKTADEKAKDDTFLRSMNIDPSPKLLKE